MAPDLQPSEARLLTDRLRNSVATGQRFDKEQTISERDGTLQMVIEGAVLRQRYLYDGRCQTIAIYYRDDIINLPRFVRHTANTDRLLVLRGTVMASVEPAVVEELRHMALSGINVMAALVTRELGIAQERLICIGQRSAAQGMAHFFCETIVRSGRPGENQRPDGCHLPLTQDALGNILGLSSVHVNRTLQHLRGKGLADLNRSRLVVHDFDGLAELAEFDGGYLQPIQAIGPTPLLDRSEVRASV